jgi:hypothetical protein
MCEEVEFEIETKSLYILRLTMKPKSNGEPYLAQSSLEPYISEMHKSLEPLLRCICKGLFPLGNMVCSLMEMHGNGALFLAAWTDHTFLSRVASGLEICKF